jgi:hypothetical protein
MKHPKTRTERQRFSIQRSGAARRGVGWKLTFDEWWKIWQDSGHWEGRGRGSRKYCMCRIGDAGPYAVGNVFIGTNAENVADATFRRRHKHKLPRGVRAQKGSFYASKMIDGVQYHIGTFPTVELAKSAYEGFSGPDDPHAAQAWSEWTAAQLNIWQ